MKIIMEFINKDVKPKLLALNSLLERISKPNAKYIHDSIEYEFTLQQNKSFIATHIFLIITFWISYIVFGGPLKLTIIRNMTSLMLLAIHYFSIQYNPYIFKVLYAIICPLYGLSHGYIEPHGVGITYISTHVLPIFVYVFTGSLWLTLFDMGVFVYFQNMHFKELAKDAMYQLSSTEFAEALIYGSNVKTVLFIALILITHYFNKIASYRIYTTEKRKNEIENQKIFLLSFSHELRNLINSLTGNVKLVTFEVLNTRARELLLNAEVCGELLLHLVNNILDTGKVEIGELEINPSATKIYDTLERIWGICSELIRRKNFTGNLKIQNNIPKNLMIDHYRITQIFLNLVGNAIKFTERGHITIRVEWLSDVSSVDENCFMPYPYNDEDDQDEGLFEKNQMFCILKKDSFNLSTTYRKIQQSALEEAEICSRGVLKVVVRDTGCGMTKEELGKLFNKFTQVTSDISKKKLGTGLGLFITKQLCQRMGGDIRAYSKKGKGSSFIFCLPVNCAPNNIEYLNDVESVKALFEDYNLTTLIVEDEPLLHSILGNFFSNLNIKVSDIAVNGLEAYHKYSQFIGRGGRPNIVTMDLDMPIMDGKEAARKIRQLETEGKIKPCFLLIISGNCSDSEINECLDKQGTIRADAFLKKPINIDDLLRIFRCNLKQLLDIS